MAAVSINQDREAYALAAGFALGLINLGRGRWSSGVSNGSIAETLRRLILGGAWGAHHSWLITALLSCAPWWGIACVRVCLCAWPSGSWFIAKYVLLTMCVPHGTHLLQKREWIDSRLVVMTCPVAERRATLLASCVSWCHHRRLTHLTHPQNRPETLYQT